jgi:hypothetical protein
VFERRQLAAALCAAAALGADSGGPASAVQPRPGAVAIGIQDDRVFLHDAGIGRRRGFELADRLRVSWLRVNVVWGEVRAHSWAPYEELVAAARERGIAVHMTIVGTPAYLAHLDTTLSWRSASPARTAAFAREVAVRFRGSVARYSVWNEPNHPAFLASRRESARTYRAMYRAAYAAIKDADPASEVLIGELAPAGNAVGWLDGMTRGREPLVADGFAVHPYQPVAAAPGAPYPPGRPGFSISNADYLRAVLRALARERRLTTPAGRAVPAYATEFGYQTDRPLGARYANAAADDRERGRLLASALAHAADAGMRKVVLYQLERTPPDSHDEWDTGLVDNDGAPTAAFEALVAAKPWRVRPGLKLRCTDCG